MHTTRSRLAAGLVVAAAALSLPVAAANAGPLPQIGPPTAVKILYVLPPKDSPFYQSTKDAAIGAGYEVVENDGRTPAT
jgi:ABC-type sugar transport system substrate-binding protein